MLAEFPESTVIFGELRRSLPCFWASARTTALTSKSPMKPVRLANAPAAPPSETPPGIVAGATGTTRLGPPLEVVELIVSEFPFDEFGNALISGRVTPSVE